MKIKKQKSSRKKITIASLAVLLLVGLSFVLLAYTNKWVFFETSSHTDDQGRKVSLDKSSQEKDREKIVSESSDEKLTNQSDNPVQPEVSPTTQKRAANVLLTNTGQALSSTEVDASGVVTNIVDTDGTCTYIFKSDATQEVVRKEVTTLSGPKSMSCKTVRFPGEELSSGSWSVSVEYVSPTAYGISEPMELVVR